MAQETKTLDGLWVGYYDNCCYGLVRIKLNGNQAVATFLIGVYGALVGLTDWQADVTNGVGQGTVGELSGGSVVNPHFVSGQLRIITPDRMTFSKSGISSANTYRRVD